MVHQKNVILAPFIHCHDPGRTVSREPNIHSGSFNNAEHSTLKQKIDEINSLLWIIFVIYVSCFHAFLSVHCSFVLPCWERANLLAHLYVMFPCVFVTFICGILCLRHVHFLGMTTELLSCFWIFIALHSVLEVNSVIIGRKVGRKRPLCDDLL